MYSFILKSLLLVFISISLNAAGAKYTTNGGCGENVANIDGTSIAQTASYVEGVDTAEEARYFKFSTNIDGVINIKQDNNKPQNGYYNHQLKIGTTCDSSDIHNGGSSTSDSKIFSVLANTPYYVKVKEANSKNVLNFDLDFNFALGGDGSSCDLAVNLGTPSAAISTIETGTIKQGASNDELWYKFVAPANPNGGNFIGAKLNYLNTDNQNENVKLYFYSGTCGNQTSLVSQTRGGKKSGSNINQNLHHSTFTPGQTYYIRLDASTNNNTKLQMTLDFYDTINRSTTFKWAHPKDFLNTMFNTNLTGDLLSIGNSNYCTDFDRDGQCDVQGTSSLTSGNQAGNVIAINEESTLSIKASTPSNLPSDLDSSSTYNNQSKATLTVATGATIEWAGLFWMGTIEDSSNLSKEPSGTLDERRQASRKVVFKTPDGIVNTLTAEINTGTTNTVDTNVSDFRWVYYHDAHDSTEKDVGNTEVDTESTYRAQFSGTDTSVNLQTWSHKDAFLYQGFVNVTQLLQNWELANNGSATGEYTVSNIVSDTGYLRPVGVLGAWNLVVVYKDVNSAFRNVSITDGFAALYDGHNDDAITYAMLNSDPNLATAIAENTASGGDEAPSIGFYDREVKFDIGGFYTPKAPATVNSTLTMFLGDGEGSTTPEEALFITQGGTETNGGTFVEIDNGAGWNGAITNKDGTNNLDRSPNLTPVMAIDIRNFPAELDNEQTAATIKMQISSDRIIFGVIGFSTDLYIPQICYDYSFSQLGRYFSHDTSQIPHIHGTLFDTSAVSASIMIRNLEAGTEAENVKLFIDDVNSTKELKFYTNSSDLNLRRTVPNGTLYTAVPSGDISIHTEADLKFDFVKSPDVLGYTQNVFANFNLQPYSSGPVDAPLNMRLDFDYTLNGIVYELRDLPLTDTIPRCTSAPSTYAPAVGIYSVVDALLNPTVTEGSTNIKYNIPTQVANRPTAMKIVSFDPVNTNTVKASSGILSVELIDVAGYYDVNASCSDPNSALTARAWVTLGNAVDVNSTSTNFDSSLLGTGMNPSVSANVFYSTARENTAYRISYNLNDSDGSIELEVVTPGTYKLKNFTTYAGQSCATPISANGNDTVPQWCGNNGGGNGSGMSASQLRDCMECIYGSKTVALCSRDNFSIRPEAFDIKIKDTDGVNTVNIPNTANLSAGYNYSFDINATNHANSNATPGYTVSFSDNDRNATFNWEPNGRTVSGCDSNASIPITFYLGNGETSNQDRNHTNVGRYQFSIIDTDWTNKDKSPTHHVGTTNWIAGDDCLAGSNVPLYNVANPYNSNLVGCDISSSHTNLNISENYSDYNLTFRPHHFNLAFSFTKGTDYTTTLINQTDWVYMNNIAIDENMSIRYSGLISAQGANNGLLSNFVDNCYAEPVTLDVNLTYPITAGLPNFRSRLQEHNATGNLWRDSNNIIINPATNTEFNLLTLNTDSFLKASTGAVDMNLSINFDRNQSLFVNPIELTLENLQVKCQVAGDCTSYSEQIINHNPDVNMTTNSTIRYLYGRTHAPRQRFVGANGSAFIYYEAYCNGAGCDKNLLPNGNPSKYTDDSRWFVNTAHDPVTDGDIGVVSQKGTSNFVQIGTIANATGQTTAPLDYENTAGTVAPRGYPYKATMENTASGWLIYNRFDSTDDDNEFEVEFGNASSWAGEANNTTTTQQGGAVKTNRRSMW